MGRQGGGGDKKAQLFGAILNQKLPTVRWGLANAGVAPATRDDDGKTTFMIACAAGRDKSLGEMIRWYERRLAQLRECLELTDDDTGETCFHMAAQAPNGQKCVSQLLDAWLSVDKQRKDAGIKKKDNKGRTVYDVATPKAKAIIDEWMLEPETESEDEEAAQDCVRSSYEYLNVEIDVNRELAPQIEKKCNTTSCGFRQVLTDKCGRWTMSVYGAQSAEESVEAFLAEIDDADVRDAVDDASKAHLIQHVQGERDRRTARLEAHAAWASSKPTDALDALRRAVDAVTGPQRAALEDAFAGVKDALNAAKRRADGVRDATTRASAAGYDAERADLPASRRDACFDHPILQAHHGGPASNLAVAQHSPDPAARATPLLRIIPHRHELPSLLRDLGLDRVGAELGVWKGSYSRRLLSELPDLTLHLVDSWEPVDIYQSADKQNDAYAETLQAVAPYKERTRVLRNWTSDAAKSFEDQSLDFVYVDASHDYRNCRADLIDWWPKVKVGGLFAGNDYYTGHVAAAGVTFGVKDAVDEFAAVRNLRVYVTAGNDPDGCCPDWYVLKCGE